jgi:hypothetical protein
VSPLMEGNALNLGRRQLDQPRTIQHDPRRDCGMERAEPRGALPPLPDWRGCVLRLRLMPIATPTLAAGTLGRSEASRRLPSLWRRPNAQT